MADIFISCASSTAGDARRIAEALRVLGYSIWRDDQLPSHRAYGDVIEEQLGLAKAVVVVWSAAAVRSDWVRSEADRARGENKLVQLAIDGVRLPMPFDQIQCPDLRGWEGEADHAGWAITLASVRALAGDPADPSAAPPRPAPDGGLMAVLAAEIEGIGLLRLNHRAALDAALEVCVAGFHADARARDGVVFRQSDGMLMAAFASPRAAVAAAVQAQTSLSERDWPGVGALKVRMAVHFGAVEPRGADYFGPALNRVTRLLALAQGEQILVTGTVAELLSGAFGVKPLGAHALEDPLTTVALFQIEAPGLKPDFAPIAVGDGVQVGNLPRRQGALIGRESEMAQIAALFENADLVTVTGTGGVGKTRIALEFAHQRQGQHEDGVWLVELAPLADPGQVTGAIARALGMTLPPFGDPVQALVDRLRPRDCLIVLDNCEHVIDAVAAVAEASLEQAPKVKLLASSQELIGVEGERVFRLRSLGEPDAVALFTERAKAADASFVVSGRDAAAVAAICQRLDGIPLAIEMAAARAPALGCDGVLQRLDDRFRILTGGRRTALPRQRTLQATLDWSHGLLPSEDAAVFRRLGVFTGGFTLEAASKVASDEALDAVEVIDALSSLVAKSLVVADTEDNRTRYRLLETTRMYALERMAEADETLAVQRRHAQVFAAFAEGAGPDYYSLPDDAFHARYAADMDNIERALDWAFGPDGDDDLGLALTAWSWAAYAGFSKSFSYLPWSDLALSRLTDQTPAAIALLVRRTAATANAFTRIAPAPAMAEPILPLLRAQNEPGMLGDLLMSLTMALVLVGRPDEAEATSAELAALLVNLPTTRLTLGARRAAAFLAGDRGDTAGAVARYEGGMEMARAIGAYGWADMMLIERVVLDEAMEAGDAISRLRDLLAGLRPNHMFSGLNGVLATYALVQRLAQRNAPGDVAEGYRLARTTEKAFGRMVPGNSMLIVVSLAIADGRPRDAARLFGHGEAQRAAYGVNLSGARDQSASARAALRIHLSEADLTSLMAEGARLTPEQHFILAMKLEG